MLSVSAVGSLREEIRAGRSGPGRPVHRPHLSPARDTFFGDGVVGHVSFAEPTCCLGAASRPRARGRRRAASARRPAGRLHRGGTYVCMEGPQFSTRAESLLLPQLGRRRHRHDRRAPRRSSAARPSSATPRWRWSPTTTLARRGGAVTVAAVVEVMRANVAGAQEIVRRLPPHLDAVAACGCGRAAAHAMLTAPRRHFAGGAATAARTLWEGSVSDIESSLAAGRRLGRARHRRDPRRKARPRSWAAPPRTSPSRHRSWRRSRLTGGGRHRLPRGAHQAARVPRRRSGRARARRRADLPLGGRLRPRLLDAHHARHAAQRLPGLSPQAAGGLGRLASTSSWPTSIRRCSSTCWSRPSKPKFVACDTMNFWIEGKRPSCCELLAAGRHAAAQRRGGAPALGRGQPPAAARAIRAMGPKAVVIKRGDAGALLFHEGGRLRGAGIPDRERRRPHRRRRLVRGRLHGLAGARGRHHARRRSAPP